MGMLSLGLKKSGYHAIYRQLRDGSLLADKGVSLLSLENTGSGNGNGQIQVNYLVPDNVSVTTSERLENQRCNYSGINSLIDDMKEGEYRGLETREFDLIEGSSVPLVIVELNRAGEIVRDSDRLSIITFGDLFGKGLGRRIRIDYTGQGSRRIFDYEELLQNPELGTIARGVSGNLRRANIKSFERFKEKHGKRGMKGKAA